MTGLRQLGPKTPLENLQLKTVNEENLTWLPGYLPGTVKKRHGPSYELPVQVEVACLRANSCESGVHEHSLFTDYFMCEQPKSLRNTLLQ